MSTFDHGLFRPSNRHLTSKASKTEECGDDDKDDSPPCSEGVAKGGEGYHQI